jgi:hypothetical protein
MSCAAAAAPAADVVPSPVPAPSADAPSPSPAPASPAAAAAPAAAAPASLDLPRASVRKLVKAALAGAAPGGGDVAVSKEALAALGECAKVSCGWV